MYADHDKAPRSIIASPRLNDSAAAAPAPAPAAADVPPDVDIRNRPKSARPHPPQTDDAIDSPAIAEIRGVKTTLVCVRKDARAAGLERRPAVMRPCGGKRRNDDPGRVRYDNSGGGGTNDKRVNIKSRCIIPSKRGVDGTHRPTLPSHLTCAPKFQKANSSALIHMGRTTPPAPPSFFRAASPSSSSPPSPIISGRRTSSSEPSSSTEDDIEDIIDVVVASAVVEQVEVPPALVDDDDDDARKKIGTNATRLRHCLTRLRTLATGGPSVAYMPRSDTLRVPYRRATNRSIARPRIFSSPDPTTSTSPASSPCRPTAPRDVDVVVIVDRRRWREEEGEGGTAAARGERRRRRAGEIWRWQAGIAA